MKQILLTPRRLFLAYSQGYFPMPDENSAEILWFRPDPRAIIPLNGFHVSKSLKKFLKKKMFNVTYNKAFDQVMHDCAKTRSSTWINEEFIDAYTCMHRLGAAHSVEVWDKDDLVGGVYGVSFGGAFFAESMFHRSTNSSKIALFHLIKHLNERRFDLLECQFLTEHLRSLGAIEIPDIEYMKILKRALEMDVYF